MIKIIDVVEKILLTDDVAFEALRYNILNLSAYAKLIKSEVEKKCYKSVLKNTIVVALTRLENKFKDYPSLKPTVLIEQMSVKSPLSEITFEKTQENISFINSKKFLSQIDIFAITYGSNEITVIYTSKESRKMKPLNIERHKGEYRDLAAITVKFDESKYIEVPNMIYSLIAKIAAKRINLIEIVSTYTEISFIVRIKDLQLTLSTLQDMFPER